MATTTNYSWSTPDDTALVKDGAAAIRSLGTAIDTTVFNNAGAAIAKTIVDAKGDLIIGSAADTVARLAVGGTNGHVLTVNSGATYGAEWAAAPAAAPASANARVDTQQSTSSTSFTDLTTVGPQVTLTTGTKALVLIVAQSSQGSTTETHVSFDVSGATTLSANNNTAIVQQNPANNTNRQASFAAVTLTAGSNTFTMKYRTDSSTGYFLNRQICVIDLGS